MGRKKSQTKYDPTETLSLQTLSPKLEPLARELYQLACCGANDLRSEFDSQGALAADSGLKVRFFRAAHAGLIQAQSEIVASRPDFRLTPFGCF